jgi:sterol desaturase/sphingolipid hydroxylase (fatty acid hydroxylase superfamily)
MPLTKLGYYADFFVYPAMLLILVASALHNAPIIARVKWGLASLVGAAVWSLLEFLAHRFILHKVSPFRQLHASHHADPRALIGTPTWLSFAAIVIGAFVPLWREAGLNLASGLTAGLMLGYLWYVSVHHAVHRWPARPGSYLYRAKVRHAWHHGAGASCNFGVTTGWWDVVFGSARILQRRQNAPMKK